FVESACRNDAAPLLEGVAEHRLFGNGFGARVERRGHFLRRFLPPSGNKAPAHRHQFAALWAKPDDVYSVRGRDVVVRLEILWRAENAEKGVHFLPSVVLREPSAHIQRPPLPGLSPTLSSSS